MKHIVLNQEGLFEAVERKRRHEHLTKEKVAAALGVQPCTYSAWSNGGGFSADVAVRISLWLGADLRTFAAIDPSVVAAQTKMAEELKELGAITHA